MFTEAQLKRIKEIGWALNGLPGHDTKITKEDVALLVARVDDLDNEQCSCAEEIMEWTRDRLEEDLRQKRARLEDAVENARIAELMVREAERALAVVQALKDGGMYEHSDEINGRWDAIKALYAAQGMLPVPEAQEEVDNPAPEAPEPAPEPVAEAAPAPEDFSDLPPALVDQLSEDHPAKAAEAPVTPVQPPRTSAAPVAPGEQEDRLYAALKTLAAGEPKVQVRLAVMAEESGVPKGSCHAILQRLQAAGRITITKPPPKNNVPQPNIYRFTDVAADPEAPETDPPAEEPAALVPPIVAAEKLAEAWGATIKPPKPAGRSVRADAPLRERILGALRVGACTSMGLASMLGVKELPISQTLSAMEHEGTVAPDDIPEAGARARLWREAPQEPAA